MPYRNPKKIVRNHRPKDKNEWNGWLDKASYKTGPYSWNYSSFDKDDLDRYVRSFSFGTGNGGSPNMYDSVQSRNEMENDRNHGF